jgi:hypothetical protein
MILKVFRGVWFISFLAVVANLMWVYVELPQDVVLQEQVTKLLTLNKEVLFYSWMALVGIVNVLVYVLSKKLVPDEAFRSWFIGLIILLNLFFIISLSYIGLYNSSEKFDFIRAGAILYLTIGLLGIWVTSWPVIVLIRKFSAK